jgi:hypothetical protein
MQQKIGGQRPGAGRPKGSKNKMTIAREVVAEILDVDDARMLAEAVHKRGHTLLAEMERIACDVTQPIGARIMAAKVALPFMLAKRVVAPKTERLNEDMIELLQQRRIQLSELRTGTLASADH